jgi:murein hydrolase activator
LVFFVNLAIAKTPSINDKDIQILLSEEKKELDILKKKLQKHNKKLSSVKKKELSLLETLSQMEGHLKLRERELEIFKWNIEINKRKIRKLETLINKTEVNIKFQKQALSKWLRIVYKEGKEYPVRVLFSSKNISDLIERVKYMQLVAEYDTSLFKSYEKKLEKLLKDKNSLLKVRTNLMLLMKDSEIKRKEISEKGQKKRTFLARLKKEKKLGLRVQKELSSSSKVLNTIISSQEEKLKVGESFNLEDHRGRLSLPVKGKILNRFGKKRDKRYASYIVLNGISIQTPKSTPVRSVYSGKVLYTGQVDGYGNLIIVGHGAKYHTVYGHLDKIITAPGKLIRKGQIIGKSGDTGSIVGESLYFELRKEGKAINPSGWFRMAKK